MNIVNICHAKKQLSKLLEQATGGKDVVIARNGKPIARLTNPETTPPEIRLGVLKGKVKVAKDFDAPLRQRILAEFEND